MLSTSRRKTRRGPGRVSREVTPRPLCGCACGVSQRPPRGPASGVSRCLNCRSLRTLPFFAGGFAGPGRGPQSLIKRGEHVARNASQSGRAAANTGTRHADSGFHNSGIVKPPIPFCGQNEQAKRGKPALSKPRRGASTFETQAYLPRQHLLDRPLRGACAAARRSEAARRSIPVSGPEPVRRIRVPLSRVCVR